MSAKTADAYKVHVDHQGQVWMAPPNEMPILSATSDTAFMTSLPLNKEDKVQIIADNNNIQLILHLFQRKTEGNLTSLKVCSPITSMSAGDKKKRPEVAMLDSSFWSGWPASLGGWHEFTESDYPSYFLATYYKDRVSIKDNYETSVINVLRAHPAWRALSFIPHLDKERCASLIATILDPRWFIDPDEPEKNCRLEAYLGLTPHINSTETKKPTAKEAELKKQALARQVQRANLVKSVWRNARPISKEDYNEPNHFLWRQHAVEDPLIADLRTSQTFVAFLKSVWLDGMYRNNKAAGCDRLFVPEYFFKRKEEAKAFNRHMMFFEE